VFCAGLKRELREIHIIITCETQYSHFQCTDMSKRRYYYQSVVVVAEVVDLYSASRSASNALIVPLRRKKKSFQRRFEAVGTPSVRFFIRLQFMFTPTG